MHGDMLRAHARQIRTGKWLSARSPLFIHARWKIRYLPCACTLTVTYYTNSYYGSLHYCQCPTDQHRATNTVRLLVSYFTWMRQRHIILSESYNTVLYYLLICRTLAKPSGHMLMRLTVENKLVAWNANEAETWKRGWRWPVSQSQPLKIAHGG